VDKFLTVMATIGALCGIALVAFLLTMTVFGLSAPKYIQTSDDLAIVRVMSGWHNGLDAGYYKLVPVEIGEIRTHYEPAEIR